MKYIAFLEVSPEELDKALEVDKKRRETGKAVKTIFPSHVIADTSKGILEFVIFESDDEFEIAEYVQAYTRVGVKMKVYPIWTSSKGFEIWKKLKQ